MGLRLRLGSNFFEWAVFFVKVIHTVFMQAYRPTGWCCTQHHLTESEGRLQSVGLSLTRIFRPTIIYHEDSGRKIGIYRLYMGCSDASEFEHIYGQILTTPSCVYGRVFTWTRMVDFNALIAWKTFIDICFSIKSSLWALTAAYTKFLRMIWSMIWSCGHRSRPRMCTVTSSKRRETSLGKSWKHTTL